MLLMLMLMMPIPPIPCWFCHNHTSLHSPLQTLRGHFCLRTFDFPLKEQIFAQLTNSFHLGLSFHCILSEKSSLDPLHK